MTDADRAQRYYREHREEVLNRHREYYLKNCDAIKAKTRKANRERYYWWKENGLCTICGSEKAVEGRTQCAGCIEYQRRYREMKRRVRQ